MQRRGVAVTKRDDFCLGTQPQARQMILQRDAAATDDGQADWFHKNRARGEYGSAIPKDKHRRGIGLGGPVRLPTIPSMNGPRTATRAPLFLWLLLAGGVLLRGAEADRPNFVIIFTDDQGYQDVGCFGSPDIKTPHLDRMAREGMRFTDFYVGQPVCTASRAALLTGCYPNRIGLLGALGPKSKVGISDKELTIAQILKTRGYATAIFGKWHLGDSPQFLPTRHGFDRYFGLPYSNDMWPNHPANPRNYPPLPLIQGEQVVGLMPDQTQLTTWYTERALRFIERNKDRPFFLYVAHNMPHVPLHVSEKFKGKSDRGLYCDAIMEIDWSVGQILASLKSNGLDEKTLVVFTSDNGPWLLYGNHAGSALPLPEGKP